MSYVNQLKCDDATPSKTGTRPASGPPSERGATTAAKETAAFSSDASLDVHLCQFAPIASLNGSAKRPNGAPKLTLNETAWVDDLRLLTR
jgi:hypothetical protein